MVMTTLGLALVLALTIALIGPLFDLQSDSRDLAAACLMLFLLAVTFGTIALAVGCCTGRRGLANGIAGALGDGHLRAERPRSGGRRASLASTALAVPLVPGARPVVAGVGG